MLGSNIASLVTVLGTLLVAPATPANPPAGAPPAAMPGPSWKLSLVPAETTHGVLQIDGRVLGEDGQPRRGLKMLVHHAATRGHLCRPDDPSLVRWGTIRTNVLGEFRVRTEMPGMAEGVPHVHFEFEVPGRGLRTIGLWLARPGGAGSDTLYAKLPWEDSVARRPDRAHVTRDSEGNYWCNWDLALEKSIEMPRSEAFQANERP